MPVKTFKKRKGESWFSVAERKFGDRDIGYDLIKKFGEGRSGVQYRFNSDLARGKAGIGRAFAEALGLDPLGGAGVGVVGTGTGEFVPPTAPTLPGQREFGERTLSEIEDLLGGLEATGGVSEGGQRVGGGVFRGGPLEQAPIQTQFPVVTGGPLEQGRAGAGTVAGRVIKGPGISPGRLGGPLEGSRIPESKGRFGGPLEGGRPPTPVSPAQTLPERIAGSIGSAFSQTADRIATDIINPLVGFDPQAPSAEPPQPEELNRLSGVTLGKGEADFGLVDPTTGQRVRTDSPTNHPGGWNFGEVTAQADIYNKMMEDGDFPPAMADITARLASEDMDDYEIVLEELGYVLNEETGYWILSTGEPTGSGTNNTGIGLGFYGGAGRGAGRLAGVRRNQPLTYIPTGSNPFSWRVNFG